MSLSEKDEEIHKMSLGIKVVDDGLEVLAAVHQKIPLIQKLCADVDHAHSSHTMQNANFRPSHKNMQHFVPNHLLRIINHVTDSVPKDTSWE